MTPLVILSSHSRNDCSSESTLSKNELSNYGTLTNSDKPSCGHSATMTIRSDSSANADVIRIPSELSTPKEPTWKSSSKSATSKLVTTSADKATLLKDVEAVLSSIKSLPTHKIGARPKRRHHQDPTSDTQHHYDKRLYADYIPVPGSRSKKNIYTLAPVLSEHWDADEYMERFEYVQYELKRAIDRHRELRDHAQSINFHLNMVGTCPQLAEPSIVIVCREAQFKTLRDLFKKNAGYKLYCGKRSRVFEMFKKDPPARPPFNLVYYRAEKETLTRKAGRHTVSIDTSGANLLPGTPIYYQGAQANIGLTLNVDNVILSTTVDHLFRAKSHEPSLIHDDDTSSITSFDSDQRTLNDADLVTLNPLWADDSDDDDPEEPYILAPTSPPLAPRASASLRDLHSQPDGHKVDAPIQLPRSAPYLDYALLRLCPSMLQTMQPNTYRLSGTEMIYPLRDVATKPRYHAVPVYMLSGARGIRTGRLLGSYAYLGSASGQEQSKAWTLILDGSDELLDGDCGSIVIDQETHSVYGHVIGSNPMNQVYVVPFKDIIDQIEITFAASDVSLYDPSKAFQVVASPMLSEEKIEFKNKCQAIVPYRRSDSDLLSLTKTSYSSTQFISHKFQTAENRDHSKYAKSYEAFTCICGRKYEDLPSSPLGLEKYFRNATRPTSRAEVLAFWLHLLQSLRPKERAYCLRQAEPKERASQKSLVCRQPNYSFHYLNREETSSKLVHSCVDKTQSTTELDLDAPGNIHLNDQLIRIPPTAWSKRGAPSCHFCDVRQNFQRAYQLFSIGGLLLESLVWVLAGHDGLNDLQQHERDSNMSPIDRDLKLFNKKSVSLHAKAFANGDSASLEMLNLTERILNQDLDFPELWRWQQKMSEEFERRLAKIRTKDAHFLGKRTSNKRALDSFIIQNFARNPVVDPNESDPKVLSKPRETMRRVGHTLVRMFSRDSSFVLFSRQHK